MSENDYRRLAARLDALPNGYPPTPDGVELRLLEKLFTPEEAALAAELRLTLEMPAQVADRLSAAGWSVDPDELARQLKSMARKGLIAAGRVEGGLGFRLMPFVVGIYENQLEIIDQEIAQLFEDYYKQAFSHMLPIQPAFHRVIPVGESIKQDMEIRPYESASEIVKQAQSWGVMDCICRKQKALIGEACQHPVDVCMILSKKPGAFDRNPVIKPLSYEQALTTLQRAAHAGLVHSVSNIKEETTYICNCCTCACGILRGVAELGIANVVAGSAFVNQVDETFCIGCETCVEACQFGALALGEVVVHVDPVRCVGCGVCVLTCEEGALGLVRRAPEEELPIPSSETDWWQQRSRTRGIDLNQVL